jgi:O-antigen/teichoic acid export membrane protein
MNNHQSSYRQIIKATSIFGGVQIFQILIQIIRSKFVAILLGPEGMGIAGLLNSSIGLLTGLTGFGLGSSAVKDIAIAHGTENESRISTVTVVLKRLILATGILGAILTAVFAPWISQLTFGNREYTIAFIWISFSILFIQLSCGQMVILQGMRKLQYLAKANLYGSLLGLMITIPIYYKLGINGIVPGILITTIITFLWSWFYARKLNIQPIKVSYKEIFTEGKNMLSLGFVISITTLFTGGVSFIVRVFINRNGSLADVGFYTAGVAIVTVYLGMIFNAMGTDYYPRLSAVSNDNKRFSQIINQQAEITILILAPLLTIFFVFIHWGVILLYSNLFIAINDMMLWSALGMFFKACAWPMGFLFLAKGENKIFFWNEFTSSIYTLLFSIIGYKLYGLNGLGIAFLASYLITLIQVMVIMKIKYNFFFNATFIRIFLYQFAITIITFIIVLFFPKFYHYPLGIIFIFLSLWLSYRELDSRIGLKAYILKKKNNNR